MTKELYFENPEEVQKISTDKWISMGRPKLWVLKKRTTVDGNKIEIWRDLGYGKLRMVINGIEVSRGREFVTSGDYRYIAFSEVWESFVEPYAVYKLAEDEQE